MGRIKIRYVAILSLFLLSVLMLSFVLGCSSSKEIESNSVPAPQPEEKLTCPNGIGKEPFPGTCGWYIDKDKDGFCDYEK